jgi:hypothetical protein
VLAAALALLPRCSNRPNQISQETATLPTPTSARPEVLRNLYDARLTERRSDWPTDSASAWFADGGYRIATRRAGQFVALPAPIKERLTDVIVSASFRKASGPAGGGYGVVLRDQDPAARDGTNQHGRFYVFEVGDRGEFGIWRRENDTWVDIVPWTPSDAVRKGTEPNDLTVQVIGQQMWFSANNRRVASHTDTVLGEGAVGVFVGGDLNEVVLERITIYAPRRG